MTIFFKLPDRRATALLVLWLALVGASPGHAETSLRLLPTPAGPGSAEPNLAIGPAAEVVLSWLEPEGDGVALRYSMLDQSSRSPGWSAPGTVTSGSNWFVNWADFPSVVPIRENLWAAHWLVKRPGNAYAYDVAVSLSEDAGATWSKAVSPHSDNTPTEHGFVSLFAADDGVGVLWLDGRNMANAGHDHGTVSETGMTLRSAVVGADLRIRRERVVDGLVCDCCQTGVANSSSGPVAVYRNRTDAEVRDIFVSRMNENAWTAGQAVADDGWEIAGCPVNGPSIDANGNTVAVAWFTAANNVPKVRFAQSADAAASFGAAVDVATDHPTGRVGVAALPNGFSLVSWLQDGDDGAGDICIRSVSPTGELGDVRIIASTSKGRMSGFPQMLVSGNSIIMAWTDVDNGQTSVRSASLPTSALFR